MEDASIGWSRRADLREFALASEGIGRHGIKDPVSQRYYEFTDFELDMLSLLKPSLTWGNWLAGCRTKFPDIELTIEDLRDFLKRLIREELVQRDAVGMGKIQAQTRRRKSRRKLLAQGANPLVFRWRGISPDRWLERWSPRLAWLWSRGMFTAGGLFLAATVLLVLVDWSWFSVAVQDALTWWSPGHVVTLAVVLVGLKALHELGHALACKSVGGECHEIGVLWLVMVPTMYCNVSDLWRVDSRSARCLVNIAGIWIESLVAAVAVWAFWLSEPGWFHAAAANVAIVGGVSTLAFNINPLLRYDGYYLLADGLRIPNLNETSQEEWRRHWLTWLTGESPRGASHWSRRASFWLTAYAIAAGIYRLMVLVAIVWLLSKVLEPMGLSAIAEALGALVIGGMVLSTVQRERAALVDLWPKSAAATRRAWTRGLVVLGLVIVGLLIPLPRRLSIPVEAEPRAEAVSTTVEGRLIDIVPAGKTVKEGDFVARLENRSIERDLLRLTDELALQEKRLEALDRRRLLDPTAGAGVPAARAILEGLREQLAERQAEFDQLTLTAPRDGVVLSSPTPPEEPVVDRLPMVSGSLLKPRNIGAHVPAGREVCRVGSPKSADVTLFVPEELVGQVRAGQSVAIDLTGLTGHPLSGTIRELAAVNESQLSPALLQQLSIPVELQSNGTWKLSGGLWRARVEINDLPVVVPTGLTGQAWIHVDSESLAARLIRWVRQTFRLTV